MSDVEEIGAPLGPPDLPASKAGLRARMMGGAGATGAAQGVQRALGFAANFLVARFGGAHLFGGYMLGVSTAGTAATYLGFSIGSTASRFGAAAQPGSVAYRRTVLVIAGLAVSCAAASILLLGTFARPIATVFLHQPGLAGLVAATGVLGAAFILVECLGGLLSGVLAYRVFFLLSLAAGLFVGAIVVGTWRLGATVLLLGHAAGLFLALAVVVVRFRRRLWPPPQAGETTSPTLARILGFGAAEVGGGIGVGLASWWVITQVAVHDPSLHAAGVFGVSNQLKALTIIVPSFFLPVVIPFLLRYGSTGETNRILVLSTFLAGATVVLAAGVVFVALPFLARIYGETFSGAGWPVVLAVSSGVVAVATSPLMRLLVTLNVKAMAVSNLLSSVCLAVAGALLVPRWGAAGAAAAWLAAEAIGAATVLVALALLRALPSGPFRLLVLNLAMFLVLAAPAIALLRGAPLPTSLAASVLLLGLVSLWLLRQAWSSGIIRAGDLRRLMALATPR